LNPGKINLFLLLKLPSAWFCGVRVKSFDHEYCKVGVRYRWINQNPFKSMYFAVQNMAAELSTGVLVMQHINNQKVPVSMLVIKAESQYYKKATGMIYFECRQGLLAQKAIEESVSGKDSKQIEMLVNAYNMDQEKVSEFKFTWSVKPKKAG
jgi:hypothetical protein